MEKKPYSALQQQSLDETTFYMTSAINIINKKLGESYAENHPELLGAFMQTTAIANLESVLLNKLEDIEKITGKKLKPKQLQESINKVMNIWIIMDELTKLKRSGQLSGVWYTAITNTFMLDNLEVWSGQVNRTIEKLHRQQKQENSSRIFVAGSPIIFPNLKLLQLIEQAGMSITADDICSSERIMPGGIIYNDTSEYGMLRAIAERYHKACVCPTFADNSRRVNNIISTAKEYNIKGVIFNLLKGCHPYDIEAITIERKLKEHGLKFIKIETDYGKEDSQNILTRLEAFKQTL